VGGDPLTLPVPLFLPACSPFSCPPAAWVADAEVECVEKILTPWMAVMIMTSLLMPMAVMGASV